MNFSYNWFKDYIKNLPKPEKLAEILAMKVFEVGETKKAAGDFVLDIKVLPNRGPDCFSHLGIAREIAAVLNGKPNLKGIEELRLVEDKNLNAKEFIKLEVRGKGNCQRYTARVLSGVKIGNSPKWMQNRLRACGLRPINNVVDITNYVMLETGQPLHAFDYDKIKGKKIIVREAEEREKITTLDNKKYDLNENILVIADTEEPLAIAGIKGGKKAEIDKKTKIIVLESANFNQKVVRRGSKLLNLTTDASWRFEHGIDPNLTQIAINRAAYLIQNVTKGKIAKGIVNFYPRKVLPKRIKLELDYVERLLGVKIPEKEIKNILFRLGFEIKSQLNRQFLVEVPTFRLDIFLPEDLIEELGRIYGYQKIPSVLPTAALTPSRRNLDIIWEDMTKNILKETGFSEVYNYSFIDKRAAEIFDFKLSTLIEIENPVSADYQYLRPSLIPGLLKNVVMNQKFFKEIRIFELGNVFKNEKRREKRMLTGLIQGEAFYQLKGVVDFLFEKLGISNVWYDSYKPTPEESKISFWEPKKCAEIKIGNEEIGFMGEISPEILKNLNVEGRQVVFDLDFEKLSKLATEEQEYQPISQYPAAIRDIAILVPGDVKVDDVLNILEGVSPLIKDIDLFDIYEGEEIPEGKKNLAFHIIYQAEDKTLSSDEIDKIQEKIVKTLEENPEWEVRK